jgi:hypothetical protein
MHGEIRYERARLVDPSRSSFGVLYHGFTIQRILSREIEVSNLRDDTLRVVLTNRLLGTWDPDDRRVHARVAVFGFPSLISAPGAVVAPARPVEEYLSRRLGLPEPPPRPGASDRFLEREDPRLTEVLAGYGLQALFYHLTGDPFCGDPDCRLFNAHRQEDMLHAQLREGAGLCEEHGRLLLEALRGS